MTKPGEVRTEEESSGENRNENDAVDTWSLAEE